MSDQITMHINSDDQFHQAVGLAREMLEEYRSIRIKVQAGKRSTNQNSLYWEWIERITEHLNRTLRMDYKTNEIHTRMKHDFLGYTDPKQIGKVTIPPQLKSTATLTKGEMFAYMETLDHFWANAGLHLPRPDDNDYSHNKRQNEGQES